MNDNLYREELMEIYKHPRHRGVLADSSVAVSEKNPLCGDEITLQLDIKEGIIANATFDGAACAVSVISSTYVLDYLIGKSLEEARGLTKEKLLELIGINLSTSRVKCATLVLTALQSAIKRYDQTN